MDDDKGVPMLPEISPSSTGSMTLDESRIFRPQMPDRSVLLEFYIDTNRINARESLPYMNQLEKWHRDDVISL